MERQIKIVTGRLVGGQESEPVIGQECMAVTVGVHAWMNIYTWEQGENDSDSQIMSGEKRNEKEIDGG